MNFQPSNTRQSDEKCKEKLRRKIFNKKLLLGILTIVIKKQEIQNKYGESPLVIKEVFLEIRVLTAHFLALQKKLPGKTVELPVSTLSTVFADL